MPSAGLVVSPSSISWHTPRCAAPSACTLQTLENLCDLTLESWDDIFSHKLIFRLQFGDGAIRTVHLHPLCVRIDHPNEPDSSSEPVLDFAFNCIRCVAW